MTCPLTPIADSVICQRPDATERKTAGGLVLPQNTSDRQIKCRVVAAGPGRVEGDRRWPLLCAVGDWVWFDKQIATTINEGGQEYLIIVEHNITCITKIAPPVEESTIG